MKWQPVALIPFISLFVVSTGSGQEKSCAQLCQLDPLDVPPECVCAGGSGGSGSTASSLFEMTPDEVFEAERENYAERMAGIENYWVVVHSNISPMAEVRYYEKEGTVDGYLPYYRLVPNSELAQRETLENPNAGAAEKLAAEDPNAFLQAYAEAVDIIASETDAETGGAASGLLGALADGLREAGGDYDEQKEQDEQAAEDMLPDLAVRLMGPLGRRRMVVAVYHPEGSTPGERLGERMPRGTLSQQQGEFDRLRREGKIPCGVESYEGPYEREVDATLYTVEHFERWVCYPGGVGPVRTYIRVDARTVTAAGIQRVTIEKETDHYRDGGPLIPHRTRQRVSGALTEVLEVIRHVSYNSGPPTQLEIAEHSLGTVGVPGARPSAP